uniref:Transmembrane protein n=1 Tax=Medicago truncatula TaxID=3880 RepID=I3SXU8_MEDTR|nr:unknown [Medicago truncatula]
MRARLNPVPTLMLLDRVKIASYVYITLHCLFCEILFPIYVLQMGPKYWPKVLTMLSN